MPFVDLLLQNLLSYEEVPTWTSKNLINFIKLHQITRIIKQIKSYQMPLSIAMPTSEAVREYLTGVKLIILEEKDQYKFFSEAWLGSWTCKVRECIVEKTINEFN